MANVVLKDINKIYDNGFHAVHDVNFVIEDKEFIVLVGPSGCGKTTTLRMVAGLEDISGGELKIDDKIVNQVAPKDRDIAMVFQNYALYPHMSVKDNMSFGLKLKKMPVEEIEKRIKTAANILDINELLERKPKQLSGGQRQRVAVGRAIVRNPKVFLFDEPLSNLDAKLRVQMRAQISSLHKRLQATMIYVTHDQVEAMTMGDRIVVMKGGYIQQIGSPMELYDNPNNKFVAGFIGSPPMNFITVKVEDEKGQLFLKEEDINILIPKEYIDMLKPYAGKNVIMGIRPENLRIDEKNSADPNELHSMDSTIEIIEPLGAEVQVYANVGKFQLTVRSFYYIKIEEGQKIKLIPTMDKVVFFNFENEERIR